MDVDTDIDQHFQHLQNQKQMLLKAKRRQGELPRDRKPRHIVYPEFMMSLMVNASKPQRMKNMIRTAFIPPPYHPCITPVGQLQPITVNQLRLETHHRGTYLLLRAIAPPKRMTGVMVLAEDIKDDTVLLQLYNQEEEAVRKITDFVDVGTVLLVKEPYYKITASGDYGLRADHLSDVVRLNNSDALVPRKWMPRLFEINDSAEPLKARGDVAMGKEQWWTAIREYSDAIATGPSPDRLEIIKRNRALAYLKTKQYDAALVDTNWPDFGPQAAEKALFRAAEALYHLRRFAESVEVLKILRETFPNNAQAAINLDRAEKRCVEEQTGAYDFKALQREGKRLRPPYLDHATYIGPVEIKQTAHKGKGLFVTKTVKAGDLLLCEKAFALAYVPEEGEEVGGDLTMLINIETEHGFMGGQADLIRIIAQKMYLNPSVAPAFTSLHHGKYTVATETSVDGSPVVDSFLIERTMSLNVFGCPISSLTMHKRALKNQSVEEKAHHSCGIWPHASMINHSCTASARRSFIGDMIIVRATCDLQPGDEVTFWYQVPHFGEKIRDKLKDWGFECDCALCQDAKQTTAVTSKARTKLRAALKREMKSPAPACAAIERLVKKLDSTYTSPTDLVPRLGVWDLQMFLARTYMEHGKPLQAFKAACKALTVLGFALVESKDDFEVKKWGILFNPLIDLFFLIEDALFDLKAFKASKKADGYARTVFKMVVGENDSFDKTYDG
ncbi:hypothetical protein DE146DRAFT_783222 [Phaeosphaeria sp. MPI-PUGE-AT-0046c]|nr:hypothetical protein DE146DRAFT_783222 [Phaeosphaeria sp. MPI-PUGE-AT-0046c]